MDHLISHAFLASIAVHVAAVTALQPMELSSQPMPVIEASLRQPAVVVQEPSPEISEPKLIKAVPAAAPQPTRRQTVAVLAVAEPSPVSMPAAVDVPPEAAPAAQVPVAVALGTSPPVVELPRFDVAYLANPPPSYPASARRRGIEGTVTIAARVGAGGEAKELKLAASSGDSALDSAAMEAVRDWRFVPARRGEQAVESWVRIPVVFRFNFGIQ